MSEQMTAKVDVDLAQPSILSRRNPLRYVMLLAGLAVLVMLPYWIYPPVAMDILCWGLFAISVDLLLGFTGLLSFGHAAFWGGSAYCTGPHRHPLGRAVPGRGARAAPSSRCSSRGRSATSRCGAPASTSRWSPSPSRR